MFERLTYFFAGVLILLLNHLVLFSAESSENSENIYLQEGTPSAQHYSPDVYGEHSQNWDIIQDDRGILYFANGHGILVFDGISWHLIETPKSTRVRSFSKGEDGMIYVGGSGDFGYLAPDSSGSLKFVSLLNEVPPSDRNFTEVWRTHATGQGIYFQTFNKLFRWNNRQLRIWRSDSEFFLSTVINDTLYLEHRHLGLMKLAGDSLQILPGSRPFVPLRMVTSVALTAEKSILCTGRQGLLLFENGALKPYPTACDNFLQENILSCGLLLQDSTIALGTYRGGLAIIDRNGQWINLLNAETGIGQDDIKNLYIDRSGILWLALNYGISQVNISSPFRFFTRNHGIDGLTSAIIRHKEVLYAAGSQGVFYLQPADRNNPRPHFIRLPGIESEAFSFFSDGQHLLCGTNYGLYRIGGKKTALIKGIRDPVFYLKQSETDSSILYAGLANGLAVFRKYNDQWLFENRVKGVGEEIRSIAEQEGNILWLGTVQQGIIRLEINMTQSGTPYRIQRIGTELILPYGQIFRQEGNIFFSTEQGLKTYNPSAEKLISAESWGTELSNPERWISQIFQLDRDEFLVHSGLKNQGEYWKIDKMNTSLLGIDENYFRPLLYFGTIYSCYTEPNGIVWFGCNTGIVQFYQKTRDRSVPAYQPLVRRVWISPDSLIYGGTPAEAIQAPQINYRYNALRFEYTLPSYLEMRDNQFQYRLDGFEKNWSDWSTETRKDYTNLSEGVYHFRLRARDIFRNMSESEPFTFEVLPPWYRSWWAYTGYLLALILVLVGVDRFQRVRLIRREQQRAKLREAAIVRSKNSELQEINTRLEELLVSLRASQTEVKESESRFRSVAESASDAIITADQQGNITFWNQYAGTIFGYSQEEVLGKPLTLLMPERHRESHRKGMERLISTGETRISGKVMEIEAVRKSGEEFPIELTVSHWRTAEGIFVTGIIRDITLRKRQEKVIEQTRIELEKAYRHKSNELEKARLLQLSLLPTELPQLPHIKMAASMRTALEVGGDYYDVHLADNGTLTVVTGDATGHGLEAGMLVTATKSLFARLADEPDIVYLMQQINESLNRLKLKRLYMALQIIRIKDYKLQVCSAGMPPVLIYRKHRKEIRELMLKSLPLGGISGLQFQKKEISLRCGDIVLLLSDGLPERFNRQNEVLDYPRVKNAFLHAVEDHPEQIISHLIHTGDEWAGRQSLNDDETFVILKFK
jgi:PAS domain S-box-containing protein